MSDIAAAASYLVAAIANAADRELAAEVLDNIADLLPYDLRSGLYDLDIA